MTVSVADEVQRAIGGRGGDETIVDYVVSILQDEDFDYGRNGDGINDAVGEILVEGGFCSTAQEAADVCAALARAIKGDSAGGTQKERARAFRALESGPVKMSENQEKTLFEKLDVSSIVRTKLEEDWTVGQTKDFKKLEKRRQKEEKLALMGMEQHLARIVVQQEEDKPVLMRPDRGTAGPRDIQLDRVTVSNGGRELIHDSNVTLAYGRKYGLVGRNGMGKTTFLRAMAKYQVDGLTENITVLHVAQEVRGDDTPALQTVLECDVERLELMQRERELLRLVEEEEARGLATAGHTPASSTAALSGADGRPATGQGAVEALAAVHRRMEEIDCEGAPARAAQVLAGLQFTSEMQHMPTKSFSGGWRMRIALAQALFCEPDLLLLDEPTNHLDLHAVLWLESYLAAWPKTVVIVSHAREFLNAVCTDIVHLHERVLVQYRGNFNEFIATRQERAANAEKAAESQQKRQAQMQQFIDKFRFNAKRASLVQSRIKALAKMTPVDMDAPETEVNFKFPATDAGEISNVVNFDDVAFNYANGPMLFKNVSFGIDSRSRIALVGANGAGKSTLIKLMVGELEPTRGICYRDLRIRWGVFSQHHVDSLELHLTALAALEKAFPKADSKELRSHLGCFGVTGDMALQPLYTLSGGQKSRVALAKVTWIKPHALLLDEPSNHLDIDSVDALADALNTFPGAIVMVSHDQHLIEACMEELWVVADQRVKPFPGTFDEYKKLLKSGGVA